MRMVGDRPLLETKGPLAARVRMRRAFCEAIGVFVGRFPLRELNSEAKKQGAWMAEGVYDLPLPSKEACGNPVRRPATKRRFRGRCDGISESSRNSP